MRRTVTARLDVQVGEPSRLAVQIAVADVPGITIDEDAHLTLDGRELSWETVPAPYGGRIWVVDADAGNLVVTYSATAQGRAAPLPEDLPGQLLSQRPSRYCESDRMIGFAERLFRDIESPTDILAAVSSWVGGHLAYVSGSSGPTDGAVDTLLAGEGVCRDFAHLTIALLRARGVPARLVAVYAPGLDPMDFHAVAEAWIGGAWYVVDATLLAPRAALLRLATGRDASDTAFLSTVSGAIAMNGMEVTATVEGDLPTDDVAALVQLG